MSQLVKPARTFGAPRSGDGDPGHTRFKREFRAKILAGEKIENPTLWMKQEIERIKNEKVRSEMTTNQKSEHSETVEKARRFDSIQHSTPQDPATLTAAKSAFYSAAIDGGDRLPVCEKYPALGGITKGADPKTFLPSNMNRELISPTPSNPLRDIITVSQTAGLEIAALAVDIDGADLSGNAIEDLKTSAASFQFDRLRCSISLIVSDSVVHGTSTDLVSTIENGLRSGLAANEMYRMFARTPASAYAHMSFYSSVNGIKAVTSSTLASAVHAALADLPQMHQQGAGVVLSRTAYTNAIASEPHLQGKPPEYVLGLPVTFCSYAVTPIVGAFEHYRLNYDPSTTLDSKKYLDAGLYRFVLTAWSDAHIVQKDAFRLAAVSP